MQNQKHVNNTKARERISKNGREWDELNSISINLAGLLKQQSNQVRLLMGLLTNPQLRESVFPQDVIERGCRLVQTIAGDLNAFGQEWQNINAKHKDKTGRMRSDNQLPELLSLGMEYDDLNKRVIGLALDQLADLHYMLQEHMDKPEAQPILEAVNHMKNQLESN